MVSCENCTAIGRVKASVNEVKGVTASPSSIEVAFNVAIIEVIPGAFTSFSSGRKGFVSSRSRCFNMEGLIYFYRSYSMEYVCIRAF
jgi:hypothetical protein